MVIENDIVKKSVPKNDAILADVIGISFFLYDTYLSFSCSLHLSFLMLLIDLF